LVQVEVVVIIQIQAGVTKHLTLLVETEQVLVQLLKTEHLVVVAVLKETCQEQYQMVEEQTVEMV
jgi:hypothetical protein